MRYLALGLGFAVLSGCVAEAPPAQRMASAMGETERCVPVQQITARRATGARSLEFDLAGGQTYRNDLPEVCPGLQNRQAFDVVALEVYGSQVCAGDSFRAFEPQEAQVVGINAFPRCRLGGFTRIAPAR